MATNSAITTQQESYEYLLKIIVTGDLMTGKTCLARRFANDTFSENYQPTVGVDFMMRTVSLAGNKIKFQIWDTAGQERFRTISSTYYRGAHAAIILFDLTNRKTFENIEKWLTEATTQGSEKCVLILVGNKTDHPDRVVTKDEAKDLAEKHGIAYVETSVKDNSNVNEPFLQVTKKIFQGKGISVAWWKKQNFE